MHISLENKIFAIFQKGADCQPLQTAVALLPFPE